MIKGEREVGYNNMYLWVYTEIWYKSEVKRVRLKGCKANPSSCPQNCFYLFTSFYERSVLHTAESARFMTKINFITTTYCCYAMLPWYITAYIALYKDLIYWHAAKLHIISTAKELHFIVFVL